MEGQDVMTSNITCHTMFWTENSNKHPNTQDQQKHDIEIHKTGWLDQDHDLEKDLFITLSFVYTAISSNVVGKHVHATIPKSNMGYDQYTVPDTVAVEPTFVAFL